MLTSKKRAAKWGCRTGGIASLAYRYHRTKINFKWIQQLKWGLGKSPWGKEGIFHLSPIEHSSRSQLFLITLSGKGLWKSSSSLMLAISSCSPFAPALCLAWAGGQTEKWLLLSTSPGPGGEVHPPGRQREKKICQGSLLQAKGSKEWRGGIALWRADGNIAWLYWINILSEIRWSS